MCTVALLRNVMKTIQGLKPLLVKKWLTN